ncbi:hypothetical protein BH23BAC3_BH23BAC3_15930 [soil metagenome]
MQFRNLNESKIIIKSAIIAFIFSIAIVQQQAEAQQMFVDDAAVTTERSIQIETWYGSRESWFLTAISPVQGLELGTGIGVDSREGFNPSNWIMEVKFVPGGLEGDGSAVGFAAGALYNFDGEFEEYFAFIPYSRMILDDSSVLHFNVGFKAVWEEEWQYELITGLRGDFGITDRFALLGEVAAANFDDAFYQGRIRFSLVPDLLEMDITYGEGFRRQETAPGFNIGIAFTPDQIW